MSDLVARLRDWRGGHEPALPLLREAADALEAAYARYERSVASELGLRTALEAAEPDAAEWKRTAESEFARGIALGVELRAAEARAEDWKSKALDWNQKNRDLVARYENPTSARGK